MTMARLVMVFLFGLAALLLVEQRLVVISANDAPMQFPTTWNSAVYAK